ncbi:MAG: glycosyltransferase [Ideonella sp.]|jgi:hypothetical protein|nr:glycosyltransferase [Ideonella sp.]
MPPLSSPLLQACLTALRQQRLHEASACLSKIDPAALGPHGAALHAELQRRVAEARRSRAGTPAAASAAAATAWRGRVLEADDGPPLPGISIVGACMNRQDNLLRVLPSWLDAPVDEILIVDWSSTEPLWPMLQDLRDPRLRVVRVEDEPRWILSHAFNLGLRLARHERVYKLDADIQLEPHFFEVNGFAPGEFVRGFWRAAIDAGAHDQVFVNGSFGALKADLREVGYYDERILTYGWDDSDLYLRLATSLGRAGKLLALGSLRHLEQADEQRIAHQNIARALRYGHFAPTEHENQVNRFHTASMSEWTPQHRKQDYELEQHEAGLWLARRITTRPDYVPGQRVLAETLAARVIASWLGPLLPPDAWPHTDSLELARLVRQADRAGLAPHLMDGLRRRRNLHLMRVTDPTWRDALQHTLALLRAQQPALAEALVVVQDDGFCPESPSEADPARGLRAGPALLDVLERVVGAQPRHDLRQLECAALASDATCTRWQVDAESLANQAATLAAEVRARLQGYAVAVDTAVPSSALVTSLYDEPNLFRLTEYLACIELNLSVFETVVVVYEHSSGLLMQALQALLARHRDLAPRLLLVPALGRPSFAGLFAQQSRFGHGHLLAVAHADVVFDGTLAPLADKIVPNHAAVLSRRELPPHAGVPQLIRTAAGAPDICSADAWLLRTPLRLELGVDVAFGTAFGDSLINGALAHVHGLKVSNPCLDTHLFHVRAERLGLPTRRVASQYRRAGQSPGGGDAVSGSDVDQLQGVPWCTAEQMALALPNAHVVPWTPRTLILDLAGDPPGLAALLWLWLLGRQLQWLKPSSHLFARLRPQDASGPFGMLLNRIKNAEGLAQLMVDVAEPDGIAPAIDTEVVEREVIDGRELMSALAAGGLDAFVARFKQSLFPGSPQALPERRIELHLALDTVSTQVLIATMDRVGLPHWPDLCRHLRELPPWLAEQRLIAPFLPDLSPQAPWVASARPEVAFVTSMFRGGKHTRGYLENVAAAAEQANGEVVIVDANGAGRDEDAEAVHRFLAEHPALQRRFTLLRPERDPGLYACWRLAIEHARAPLISNANLDDRRSPGHSQRLAQLLQSRPDLAAVSGALTVVGQDEQGGWFDLVPNQTWFGEPGLREFDYDELFRRADDGTVYSQNMLHCMPVWRRCLHERFGWFDEERYGTSADWAFWLLVGRAGERFALDPQAWGRYFFNPESHNRRNDADGAKERRIIADLIGVRQDRVIKQ